MRFVVPVINCTCMCVHYLQLLVYFIVTERKTCSAGNHCKVEMEVGNCYYSPGGAFPAVHYITEYLKKL